MFIFGRWPVERLPYQATRQNYHKPRQMSTLFLKFFLFFLIFFWKLSNTSPRVCKHQEWCCKNRHFFVCNFEFFLSKFLQKKFPILSLEDFWSSFSKKRQNFFFVLKIFIWFAKANLVCEIGLNSTKIANLKFLHLLN